MPCSCAGRDARGRTAAAPSSRGEGDDLLLQVEQLPQGDVEEVAAAAGRVEHPHAGELAGEAASAASCSSLVQLARAGARLAASRLAASSRACACTSAHSPAQRRHQHRLDDQQDVLAAGVVRAELRALGRVQAALEQRAEDGRLDAGPVQRGRPAPGCPGRRCPASSTVVVVEQAAVEVRDRARRRTSRPSAIAAKSWPQLRGEGGGLRAPCCDQPGEEALGQQADVLGEQAEQQPDQEVGDRAAASSP